MFVIHGGLAARLVLCPNRRGNEEGEKEGRGRDANEAVHEADNGGGDGAVKGERALLVGAQSERQREEEREGEAKRQDGDARHREGLLGETAGLLGASERLGRQTTIKWTYPDQRRLEGEEKSEETLNRGEQAVR